MSQGSSVSPSNQDQASKELTLDKKVDIVLAEYNALRGEILKRNDLNQGIYNFTLLTFGGTIGLGLQTHSPFLAWLYPVLALFLAVVWSSNTKQIWAIGSYIRVHIESNLLFKNQMRWEHCTRKNSGRSDWKGQHENLATKWVFYVTEGLALVIGTGLAITQDTSPHSWVSPTLELLLVSLSFVLVDVICLAMTRLVAFSHSYNDCETRGCRYLQEVIPF